MRDQNYYLRVYPDGKAAMWPTPPDGETSWTTVREGTLAFGYQPPLHDPRLFFQGSVLMMHTSTGNSAFDEVPGGIEPPK